jgi:hypothetical protein
MMMDDGNQMSLSSRAVPAMIFSLASPVMPSLSRRRRDSRVGEEKRQNSYSLG